MRHLGLFEGIGGFSLAVRWMGWQTVAWCEIDSFCQKILRYHFPEAEGFGDIKTTDFKKYANSIDILTGGFPCQPYSNAGKRKGKEDERHLWPEMLRAIREVQPGYVVGENVGGLVSWNGGMVFNEVQTDLEAEGYEVLPFLLPACAVNAPHRRDRIWFVAHTTKERLQHRNSTECRQLQNISEGVQNDRKINRSMCERITPNAGLQRQEITEIQSMGYKQFHEGGVIAYSERIGQQGQGGSEGLLGSKTDGNWKASWSDPNGKWPTVSPIRGRDDGLSSKLVKQCLEALGNAIVPQVAFEIFKAIEQMEKAE